MSDNGHVDELIAWYALGALTPEERAQFESHLATCSRCRALAAQAEDTVQMIPQSVEPVTPSAALKQKLMARVDADLAGGRTRAPSTARPAERRDWLAWLRRGWAPALALASLILALGMIWWNWSLQNELASTRAFISASARVASLPPASAAPAEAQAKLYIAPDNASALLAVSGLRPLGSEQTYEFWLIRGGKPVPAGLFSVDSRGSGSLLVHSSDPVGSFDQAGVSVERAGGTSTPTPSALVFVGAIQ